MTILFTDRRCTVDVHPTANGYSFGYGGKKHTRHNEEAVHNFFLKEYQANKLDTVKLRYSDASYYLHFTLDEPEKCTKPQLRAILARECDGAWCEEKNGNKRYYIQEGWLFPKIRELTQEQFAAYRPRSTIQKAMQLALGALSLVPSIPSHVSQASGMGTLLFSLINTSPALAQMPAFGEFRINTNTTGYQRYPTLAPLNDGSIIIAWEGQQTGDFNIYGQRYDAVGVPRGSEMRVNTDTRSGQYSPTIAALKGGGFVATWYGYQTGNYDIYGQRYDAALVPASYEFRINTNTTRNQEVPTIAALNDGGFVVAWGGDQTGDIDIYSQRFNASGLPVGSEFQINANTTSNQEAPIIAALNDGSFVFAWQGNQTGDYDIYSQRYNIAGASVNSEFRVNTNTTYDQSFPAVAGLMDGGFVLVWAGLQTGNYDIYGRIYDATGIPVGSEFRINTNMINAQTVPKVVGLTNGGFVVVWVGDQTGNHDIYGQRYNGTGIPVGSEFRVNTNTTGGQHYPTVAALNDDGFFVVWQGYQTGDYDIYGQRFNANGAPVFNFSLPSSSLTISNIATSTDISGSSTSPSNPSVVPTNTSQAGSSSSSRADSSQSSMNSSPSSSQSPIIMSITELIYGTDYSMNIDGINVGTFTITGGTGLYDGTQSNTLILQLDPDADLVGQTITLFTLPSGEEGNFQTIELQGVSCLAYDTQIVQDGGSRFFQATFQATTCSTGSKPEVSLLSAMLRV